MLICHIAVYTYLPGKWSQAFPPNHTPPPLYGQPHLINHLGKNKASLGYLRREILPWSSGRVMFIQKLARLAFFLFLSKQFFTAGNKTGLLQMTSTNDAQGSFVFFTVFVKGRLYPGFSFCKVVTYFLLFFPSPNFQGFLADYWVPKSITKQLKEVIHHWTRRQHNATFCNMSSRVYNFTFTKTLAPWGNETERVILLFLPASLISAYFSPK